MIWTRDLIDLHFFFDYIQHRTLMVVLPSLIIGVFLIVALKLSVTDSTKDSASQSDMSKLLADQSFVSSILASVC